MAEPKAHSARLILIIDGESYALRHASGDRWHLRKAETTETYRVIAGALPRCSCAAYRFRIGESCKHLRAWLRRSRRCSRPTDQHDPSLIPILDAQVTFG